MDTESKDGAARTCLLRVKYNGTVVMLVGFVRQAEPDETASDIVAQAVVTDYNPTSWNERFVWICVYDPFNSVCVVSYIQEDCIAREYGRYPFQQAGPIVQHALSQNITTYT